MKQHEFFLREKRDLGLVGVVGDRSSRRRFDRLTPRLPFFFLSREKFEERGVSTDQKIRRCDSPFIYFTFREILSKRFEHRVCNLSIERKIIFDRRLQI